MKLSKRLEMVASFVPPGSRVADVGTDHGFVPIWLVKEGIAIRGIAMDVRKGPLSRAKEHVEAYGLEAEIETRLSDGLEGLQPKEADTVVIAGMGGDLMLRILQDGVHVRDEIQTFVLSPQSELSLFRHGLEALGLSIQKEVMLEEEGKYYTVMVVVHGAMHYEKEYEYRYGRELICQKSSVLIDFLTREQAQFYQIRRELEARDTVGAQARMEEVDVALMEIKEALYAMQ